MKNSVEKIFHKPVMVQEVCSFLLKEKEGIFVDATLGGGGHKNASACRVEGDLETVRARVLDAIAVAI